MSRGDLTVKIPLERKPSTAPSRIPLGERQAVLRVMSGPDTGFEHPVPMGRTLAIGVSPDNEICLRDETVSRYHAEVELTPDGVRVRDLDSSNGIYLGSVRVGAGVVPIGTHLRLGHTLIVFEDGGSSQQRATELPVQIPGLVAVSAAMQSVARSIRQLALSPVSCLVQGETGTGKEVVARAIHEASPRRNKPFVVVDCASMPSNLIASELFGHERGAFTGAERQHLGAFEQANGGTIFLDEIGELPIDLQPALLGVLERRRFRRVGGTGEVEVDVRIISATHRDLRKDANSGRFRPDLYFRLAVARIVLPPLRERPEDIEALIGHFTEQIIGHAGPLPFDPQTLDMLRTHPWSGNVRELRNVVEGAIAMGQVNLEKPRDRRDGEGSAPASEPPSDDVKAKPYREARAEAISAFERIYLRTLIERCNGNASEAARQARMDRPYLLTLLRKHGLR